MSEAAAQLVSGIDPNSVADEPEKWDVELFEYWRKMALKPLGGGDATEAIKRRKNLYTAYLQGYGTEPDHRRYFELLMRVAEFQEEAAKEVPGGDTDAIWELANCYRDGIGTESDDEKYQAWLERAANVGDPQAMVDLALINQGTDPSKFLQWTIALSEQPNPEPKTFIDLAEAYRNGIGVEKDDNKFIEFARKAVECAKERAALGEDGQDNGRASEDLPTALMLLAHAYRWGIGVAKADKEYLSKLQAANAAVTDALKYHAQIPGLDVGELRRLVAAPIHQELAEAYLSGIGTKPDERLAFKLMEQAAEFDLPSAMLRLSELYREGKGIKKNNKKAFEWLSKASRPQNADGTSGYAEGVYQCALAHGFGIGTITNPQVFLDQTIRAVNEGHEKAFMAVGLAELRKEGIITTAQIRNFLALFDELRDEVLRRKELHKLRAEEIPLLKKKDLDADEEPTSADTGIAHFTSIDALYSMLPLKGTKSTSERRNLIRLYDIQYFNDPQEGQVLLDPANDAAHLIREFFPKSKKETDSSQELFEPLPLSGLAFSVYVGSFTLRTDFLDLWRAYGSDGTGYCIVTPFDAFSSSQTQENRSFAAVASGKAATVDGAAVPMDLYRVFYGKDKATKTLNALGAVLQKIKDEQSRCTRKKPAEEKRLISKQINRSVREVLSDILFLYKHLQYRSEGEVRLLAPFPITANTLVLDERVPAKLYVPSRPMLFPPKSTIIIGPKVTDPVRVRLELKRRLEINNHRDVEVVLSRIQYR